MGLNPATVTGSHHSPKAKRRGSFSATGRLPRLFDLDARKQAMIVLALLMLALAAGLGWRLMGTANASTDNPKASSGQASQEPAAESSSDNSQTSSNSSKTSVNVQSTSNNGNASANVEVNGKQIPVSNPNSIHETFTSNGGNSTVNVNVENNSSSSSGGQSM